MLPYQGQFNPFYSPKLSIHTSAPTQADVGHPTAFVVLPKLETHRPDASESIAGLSWACFSPFSRKSGDKSASAPLSLASAAHVLFSWDFGSDLKTGRRGIVRAI